MATNQNPFTEQELQDMIDQFLAIKGPDEKSFARLNKFIEFYFSPTLFGLDNIPEGPTMFVGNHAMFGLDGMILMPTIYHQTGRFVRALADNAWFQSGTGTKMQKQGMVLANPKVCSALMERGEDLLIFPGGAAEANKTAEEKYSLVWRERTGFVRMAAQHGYNITPFGLVGPDEWFASPCTATRRIPPRCGPRWRLRWSPMSIWTPAMVGSPSRSFSSSSSKLFSVFRPTGR